jgi:hypothetical protein
MAKKLSLLLHTFLSKDHNWKIILLKNWKKILGPLHNKVIILKIERRMIVLGVTHPTLSQELFLLSDTLKKKINSLFNEEKIQYIRFKTLTFTQKKTLVNTNNTYTLTTQTQQICLTKQEYQTLSHIKDEELKRSLKQFCFRCKREKSEKRKM